MPESLLFAGLGIVDLTGFCCTGRCSCCRMMVCVRTVFGKIPWQMTDKARSRCEVRVVVVIFETLLATKKLVLTTSCYCCCWNRWISPCIGLSTPSFPWSSCNSGTNVCSVLVIISKRVKSIFTDSVPAMSVCYFNQLISLLNFF